MNNKIIYLDNNATTKPLQDVVNEYVTLSLGDGYYNINTNSTISQEIKKKIDHASDDILKIAGLSKNDFGVIYTSSSTEINKGIISMFGKENVITTPYEHKSILGCVGNPLLNLDKKNGIITPEEVDRVLSGRSGSSAPWGSQSGTGASLLVSVMAANNEFPSRNDIRGIYNVVSKYPGVVFHSDATQLFGKICCEDDYWEGPDLLNFSTHKFNGIKGVGVLIYRKSKFKESDFPFVYGTPNSPAILAHAPLWKYLLKKGTSDEHYLNLRIHLLELLSDVNVISFEPRDSKYLSPNTCLLSFPGMCNLLLKKNLDKEGVIVSIGSACDTKKDGASDTLKALGIAGNDGIIRVSFGAFTTPSELNSFSKILKRVLPLCIKEK